MSNKELYIEVESDLDINAGNSRTTNKPYKIVNQIGHLFDGGKYPTKVKIRLASESDKMATGIYLIYFNKALYVDKYSSININITPDCLIAKK